MTEKLRDGDIESTRKCEQRFVARTSIGSLDHGDERDRDPGASRKVCLRHPLPVAPCANLVGESRQLKEAFDDTYDKDYDADRTRAATLGYIPKVSKK